MLKEIDEIKSNSKIKVGDPLDASTFDLEKQRIASSLQNRGFSEFIPNYVQIKGDSSVKNKNTEIIFRD